MTANSDQGPDLAPHRFNSLDPDLDPHWGKKLDPDPHVWNQCGSTTLLAYKANEITRTVDSGEGIQKKLTSSRPPLLRRVNMREAAFFLASFLLLPSPFTERLPTRHSAIKRIGITNVRKNQCSGFVTFWKVSRMYTGLPDPDLDPDPDLFSVAYQTCFNYESAQRRAQRKYQFGT